MFQMFAFFLEDGPPRKHHIATLFVVFQNLEREDLAQERFQIADRPQIDLGARQKGLYSDIDGEPAFDLGDHLPLDDAVVVVDLADIVPDLDFGGFFLGEVNGAVFIVVKFQQHIDFIADGGLDVTLFVFKFVNRDLSFGLVADVHHDKVVIDLDDSPSDYLPLLDILKALIVKILHGVDVFKISFEHALIGLRWLGYLNWSHLFWFDFIFFNH